MNEEYHIIEDNMLFSMSSQTALVKTNGNKNSRLIFEIPNMIHMSPNITDIFFAVNTAVIPSSFYNINQTNNKIVIGNAFGTNTYTISVGNYNITELLLAINALINTAITVSFSYNGLSNKVSIQNNGATTQVINLETSTLLPLLGYENTNAITLVASQSTISINCVNLFTIPRIFLRSSTIDAGNYSNETESSDILAVIPNTACQNGVIHYVNFNGIKHLVNLQNLSHFDILITDDFSNELDFNGVPIFFTFNITLRKQVLKPPTFQQTFNKSLKLEQYNLIKSLEKQNITLN